jgi:hypothetical protein
VLFRSLLALEYAFMVYWVVLYPDFPYTYNIYLAPVYPLVMFLFTCGIFHLVSRIKRKDVVLWIVSIIFLVPFLSVKVYRCLPDSHHVRFRLPEVHKLANDLDAVIPPGSVLLCDAFLCYTIDCFTPIYSFQPRALDDSTSGINDKVAYLLDKNVPVFYCDYRGVISGLHAYYQSALEKEYSLVLVKKDQQLYNYPSVFSAPPFSIFSVQKRNVVQRSR